MNLKQDALIRLGAELAELIDAPNGVGGGAIVLELICEIEDLQRRLQPPEPTTP